jgi:hypothetical protein
MMLGSDVIKRLEDAVTPFVQVLVHALPASALFEVPL